MTIDNNYSRVTERLAKLASVFLGFGTDPVANINLLVRLGGELIGADCALYNRLDGGMLVSLGMWNAPADPQTKPDGHICYDVIKKGGKGIFIVRDLPNSPYAKTDPNVGRYNLKTYIGMAVKCKEEYVGSLCLLYHDDFSPSPEDKDFISIVATGIHIEEERRRVEETLRESESRGRAISDSARDAILMMDPEGRISYWNPAAERILGYTSAEAIGQNLHVLIMPSRYHEAHCAAFPLFQRTGQGALVGKTLDLEANRKNGEEIPVQLSLSAFHMNGAWYAVGVLRDITEYKRNERELKERNDELTRFSHTVSHDLKSPLVTITTFLDYLEEDIKDRNAEGVASNLGYIRTAADKMCRLLKELQELSRVGHNIQLTIEMPLGALLEEALALAAGSIRKRGIKTRITGERVTLSGDRQRLLEVFQNLFDNAAKFMGAQPAPLIEAGVDLSGAEPVFFVRDNGIGIDPRHQAKIFGLFEKLDPATEGTGMGLALVHRIIEAHGGRIWVESEGAGRGTTFRFTLAKLKNGG